jgi:hypothetical protein
MELTGDSLVILIIGNKVLSVATKSDNAKIKNTCLDPAIIRVTTIPNELASERLIKDEPTKRMIKERSDEITEITSDSK